MNIRRWLYFVSLALALIGALIAILGSWLVFQNQAQIQGSRVWPLPGLILLDWVLLGILGFLGALFSNKPNGSAWLKGIWFVVGALMPLVILGALSIGLFVFISLLFILAASVLITIQRKGKGLVHLALVIVGIICNLGLSLVFILANGLIG
jgi:hypothetical protein